MHRRLSPENRKAEIIQTALKLFAARGYDNTTVGNIIDAVGISKGGFYHHFRSKEELLEGIVRMLIGDMAVMFERVEGRSELTALEKTNEYIKMANAYKGEKIVEVAAFLSELYADGKNLQLESKIYAYARDHIAPIMKRIVLQGVEEGTFSTRFPQEAAETYVKLFIMQQQEMTDLFYEALRGKNKGVVETIKRKYRFFQALLEDTLGLEKGSLVISEVMGATAEAMCEKILSGPGGEWGARSPQQDPHETGEVGER